MIFSVMKTILFLAISCFALHANPYFNFGPEQKIGVQNTILTQVNGKSISTLDVKKRMDFLFHQMYPDLVDSSQARFQYYQANWKQVLMDLIDNELILADAEDKEIKVTDSEIRERLEERFGPNIMTTLDRIGLSYDETWKMLKSEMIAERMKFWFIQLKAINSVTPQDIRQAYQLYLKKHPAYSEWKYRVVTIRSKGDNDALASQIHQKLVLENKNPIDVKDELKKLESENITISVSNEFNSKTDELSDMHKASLKTLSPKEFSQPSYQLSSADKKSVYRIFYLIDKTDFQAPTFNSVSLELREELQRKAMGVAANGYLTKLRKHYGFEAEQTIPEDLQPFSIQ